jgi:hypothetical protein
MFIFLFVTFLQVVQSSVISLNPSACGVVSPEINEKRNSEEKDHKGGVKCQESPDQVHEIILKQPEQQRVVIVTAVYEHNQKAGNRTAYERTYHMADNIIILKVTIHLVVRNSLPFLVNGKSGHRADPVFIDHKLFSPIASVRKLTSFAPASSRAAAHASIVAPVV